ncbi:recombinase family protein [Streptosporangium sp. CA-115845]|uniref:recombinase family protein n=1 Tax=Streptosporangium sp. CA-115845 TaxID=3240071 RepID=UPI003D8C49B0
MAPDMYADATEAGIVREIVARYVAGATVEEIAEHLNRNHAPVPGARRWLPDDIAAAAGVDLAALHREVDGGALDRWADEAANS